MSACFAFGGVKTILASLENLFLRLGPRPASVIDDLATAAAATRCVRDFRHRWLGPAETATILRVVRSLRREFGSLEGAFSAGDDPSALDVRDGLAAFSAQALKMAGRSPGRAIKFAFAAPGGGSACKRQNLFLRWCVRPADGLDLGLWSAIDRSRLIVPIDVHLAFHARVLGFTRRTTADWRTALETTAALRRFDPADPVRFDFALCHAGIHGDCRRRRDPVICPECPLDGVCRLPRPRSLRRG